MSNDDWWGKQLGQPPAPRQTPVYAPQTPSQAPQVPQYPQQQFQPQTAARGHGITPENFMEAASAWQGGKGVKTETQPCPQCGGDHYFSRKPEGPSRLPPPAPMCADCGYTGLFYQDPVMPTPRES